jgi:hypothetical protein
MLLDQADSALSAWLIVPVVPTSDLFDQESLAYQWATAGGLASRACRARTQSSCLEALGIDGAVSKEFTPQIRSAILAAAIDAGGAGAWTRLMRAAGLPLSERLRAAAGRDVETVVAEWTGRLREARREAGLDHPTRWLAGMAWTVLVAAGVVAGAARR